MKRLAVLVLAVLVCVSVFAEDEVTGNIYGLFQGNDKGLDLNSPLTRGQFAVLLRRYNTKIVSPQFDLWDNIIKINNKELTELSERPRAKFYDEDIQQLKDQLEDTQEKLQKTRDQLAYITRGMKDQIREISQSTGSQDEWLRPFYFLSEIANSGASSKYVFEGGYDTKIVDIDYVATISPILRYADNSLYFGARGLIRWEARAQ